MKNATNNRRYNETKEQDSRRQRTIYGVVDEGGFGAIKNAYVTDVNGRRRPATQADIERFSSTSTNDYYTQQYQKQKAQEAAEDRRRYLILTPMREDFRADFARANTSDEIINNACAMEAEWRMNPAIDSMCMNHMLKSAKSALLFRLKQGDFEPSLKIEAFLAKRRTNYSCGFFATSSTNEYQNWLLTRNQAPQNERHDGIVQIECPDFSGCGIGGCDFS